MINCNPKLPAGIYIVNCRYYNGYSYSNQKEVIELEIPCTVKNMLKCMENAGVIPSGTILEDIKLMHKREENEI